MAVFLALLVVLAGLLAPFPSDGAGSGLHAGSAPKTFVWDGEALAAARQRVLAHSDPELMPAVQSVVDSANHLFGKGEK